MTSRHADFSKLVFDLDEQYKQDFTRSSSKDLQSLVDRVRRCLSWLKRAAYLSVEDRPPRFVELWIAFNSLYGQRHYKDGSFKGELADFMTFLAKFRKLDSASEMLQVWMGKKHVQGRIRDLIQNKFLWNEFWDGEVNEFESQAGKELRNFEVALVHHDVESFLRCLFSRLRVLRNQIVHGSASSDTRKNKDALVPAILLLEELLPMFLSLMIKKGRSISWPEVPYPGKLTPQHPK